MFQEVKMEPGDLLRPGLKSYAVLVKAYHRASPDSRGVEVDFHLLIGRVVKNLQTSLIHHKNV